MSFSKLIFASLACASLAHASDSLVLAPGTSVTLIDAADPTMHVVVTAPHDSQLDLSRLLEAKGKTSILSVVTGAQVKPAGALTLNPDGSISLAAPSAPASIPHATAVAGSVLVFNEGRYVGFADPKPVAVPPSAALRAQESLIPNVPASISRNLPGPAPVVSGTAVIANPSPNTAIAPSQRGVINWSQFNIGSGGTVNVTQPQPPTATTLRVQGGGTQIPGVLTSNGTVTLTTPNGAPAGGSISVGGGAITTTGAAAPGTGITAK